jgi:hypothetical protein
VGDSIIGGIAIWIRVIFERIISINGRFVRVRLLQLSISMLFIDIPFVNFFILMRLVVVVRISCLIPSGLCKILLHFILFSSLAGLNFEIFLI